MRHADEQDDQQSQLIAACKYGDLPTVKYLLSCKADPTAEDYKGRNAMQGACAFGHVKIVRCLLEFNKDLANHASTRGYTGGFEASRYGRVDVVKLLIANGAKNPPCHGMTPKDEALRVMKLLPEIEFQGQSPRLEDYNAIVKLWEMGPAKIKQKEEKVEQQHPVPKIAAALKEAQPRVKPIDISEGESKQEQKNEGSSPAAYSEPVRSVSPATTESDSLSSKAKRKRKKKSKTITDTTQEEKIDAPDIIDIFKGFMYRADSYHNM